MTSSSSTTTTTTTTSTSNQDHYYCAILARAALFPDAKNRQGEHAKQFPASLVVDQIRKDAMRSNPNRTISSFFPKHIMVVKSIEPSSSSGDDDIQWNGQPDITTNISTKLTSSTTTTQTENNNGVSFQIIPEILSLQIQECMVNNEAKNEPKAYIRTTTTANNEKSTIASNERQIVLCTNRLMKDYADIVSTTGTQSTTTMTSMDLYNLSPRISKFYQLLEETLAHQISKVKDEIDFERQEHEKDVGTESSLSSCHGVACSEIRAAQIAECYYHKAPIMKRMTSTQQSNHNHQIQNHIKRGSQLPIGYSLLPTALQQKIQNQCIRSVATKAMATASTANPSLYTKEEAKKCVNEMFPTCHK